MSLFTVCTRSNQEINFAETLINEGDDDIHAALSPNGINGYIFVEATSIDAIESIVNQYGKSYKILSGDVAFNEVKQFLSPPSDVDTYEVGDHVIITNGAYEGKEARLTHVNESTEKLTLELLNEVIQIPIELPGEHVTTS